MNNRDEIAHLGDGWVEFALANDAPDLAPGNVLGRPLWDFISDETTEQLYREILRLARSGRRVSFAFRCDAPGCRRRMEMTVEGGGGGSARFTSRTLTAESRGEQDLLDRYALRLGEHLRCCGWCKRIDVGGGAWAEIEDAVRSLHLFERKAPPPLTHGICELCYASVMRRVTERRS